MCVCVCIGKDCGIEIQQQVMITGGMSVPVCNFGVISLRSCLLLPVSQGTGGRGASRVPRGVPRGPCGAGLGFGTRADLAAALFLLVSWYLYRVISALENNSGVCCSRL